MGSGWQTNDGEASVLNVRARDGVRITLHKAKRASIRGCKGLDGDFEAGQASRSRPVYVKRGIAKLNAKNKTNLAFAA